MCGIVGFAGLGDNRHFRASVARIQHRGPDDKGIFEDETKRIFLGHTRLSILDISDGGHQPIIDNETGVVLVYNGELYNYRQLRATLITEGACFQTESDTEVVLKLFLSMGMEMLSSMDGIFAFAIWDSRTERLFLARDGFGVKPLYFSYSNSTLAFCSEVKGLLPLLQSKPELDVASVHNYHRFLWSPSSDLPLKGVKKLNPGSALVFEKGQISKYWNWYQPETARVPKVQLSNKTCRLQIKALLEKAVLKQLVSDVPVGAFLSGGLDSSSIVALARKHTNSIPCFTIAPMGGGEEGDEDDLPFAKEVAAHLGVPLNIVPVDSTNLASDIEKMIYMLDEPIADPAALNVLYICRIAAKQGVKVLLSGAGGDDIFTGYRRHTALRIERLWQQLPEFLRTGMYNGWKYLPHKDGFVRRVSKFLEIARSNEADGRLSNYFKWSSENTIRQLYTKEYNELCWQHENEGLGQEIDDYAAGLSPSASRLSKMLALEQRYFLGDHNLLYTDKMSMAAGVEVRVPFLDPELVSFAARIPDHLLLRGLQGKWILKKAMEGELPKSVIYRKKTGFGAPIRRWVRHELRELVGDYLNSNDFRKRGIYCPNAVSALVDQNQKGKIDGSYLIFSILAVEIWCRQFIDQNTDSSLYYRW
ncbi:asparagine synthase (glutamine-hydrolyzing) [Kordiimonas sp.]|uniref:asparagine synthase (glutamine-hydrolyzing) n=1 Tax=Kordiimonas sp. TaxID=1970157 RepID=UPI003B523AFA